MFFLYFTITPEDVSCILCDTIYSHRQGFILLISFLCRSCLFKEVTHLFTFDFDVSVFFVCMCICIYMCVHVYHIQSHG